MSRALVYALLHLAGVEAVNPAYEIVGALAVALNDLGASASWIDGTLITTGAAVIGHEPRPRRCARPEPTRCSAR